MRPQRTACSRAYETGECGSVRRKKSATCRSCLKASSRDIPLRFEAADASPVASAAPASTSSADAPATAGAKICTRSRTSTKALRIADVGGAVDYYQWASLLQSLSGFESYRKIYSDLIAPRRIAELLILRDDMPRSLHSCMNFIYDTLQLLCDAQSREPERQAGELHARLHFGRTDEIMRFGLHEYLMEFLEHISRLDAEVNRVFLVPTY